LSGQATVDVGVLAVAEVADRLGISVSTLRSWERRYGLGATVRTSGGHRRYSDADLTVLRHARRLIDTGIATGAAVSLALANAASRSVPLVEQSSAITDEELGQAFADALDRLDAFAATAAATSLLARRGVTSAWIDTFVPYLHRAGQIWQRTGAAIEREHLAVDAIRGALISHRDRHSAAVGPDTALVVLAATEQERHTLPLHALEAALFERGTPARTFGHLPASALRAVVDRLQPAAIVLWTRCRHDDDLDQLRAIRGRVPAVHAAGPGWRSERLPRGTSRLVDLPAALVVLTVPEPDPEPSEARPRQSR
jgi:DNA-binding transcriptional MerR regulator